MAWIQQDRVQAHSTGPWLPFGSRAVAAQSGEFMPGLCAVGRAEQGSILYAGIDGIWISQGWFEMPDSFELPRVLRAIVPLVSGERFSALRRSVVDELVAFAHGHPFGRGGRLAGLCTRLLPCLPAIAGALDHLAEPAAGL